MAAAVTFSVRVLTPSGFSLWSSATTSAEALLAAAKWMGRSLFCARARGRGGGRRCAASGAAKCGGEWWWCWGAHQGCGLRQLWIREEVDERGGDLRASVNMKWTRDA